MAVPRPPTDLVDMLAMGAVAASRPVQRPLGREHLPQGGTVFQDFLNRLLGMLRLGDNGAGPGICMSCDNCGNVRLRSVWLAPVGDSTVALRGFCPRCGTRVEARLEV